MSSLSISLLASSLEDFETANTEKLPRNPDGTRAPYLLSSVQVGSLILVLFQARQLESDNDHLQAQLSAWQEVTLNQQREIARLTEQLHQPQAAGQS